MGYLVLAASTKLSMQFGRIVTVTVTDAYWAGDRKETWRMLGYRLRGETLYRDLKTAFIVGRADVADFDWLVRSFTEDEGVCLHGDNDNLFSEKFFYMTKSVSRR
ncbi:hypothetical protein C2S52_013976 [Perilla frutescens var. hirtella]|nr:hypothetical protein C2S52_013976 [Perilla frutescens var. hirtella]